VVALVTEGTDPELSLEVDTAKRIKERTAWFATQGTIRQDGKRRRRMQRCNDRCQRHDALCSLSLRARPHIPGHAHSVQRFEVGEVRHRPNKQRSHPQLSVCTAPTRSLSLSRCQCVIWRLCSCSWIEKERDCRQHPVLATRRIAARTQDTSVVADCRASLRETTADGSRHPLPRISYPRRRHLRWAFCVSGKNNL
jgi:hypothetical protein